MPQVKGLTGVLMKEALRANNIDFRSNARVAELLQLYQTIPMENRQTFERENGVITVNEESDDVTIADEIADEENEDVLNEDASDENLRKYRRPRRRTGKTEETKRNFGSSRGNP